MFYFAYGSNMNQKQMKERCPNSKFIKKVYVKGYRFVYDGYSTTRKGAVANIVKDENCIVWGALYEITQTDLENLDKCEGYRKVYKREYIVVKDSEGKEYKNVWVYLREPQPIGRPSEEYKKIVYEGAIQCCLPQEYIEKFILQKS